MDDSTQAWVSPNPTHTPPIHLHCTALHGIQLIIARDIAKAPELTSLLKQCAKTVLGAGEFG